MNQIVVQETATSRETRLIGVEVAHVSVSVGGQRHRLAWADLLRLSRQPDLEGAAAYRAILDAARPVRLRLMVALAWDRVHACPGHLAETETVRGYTGPVSRGENLAAHGGIEIRETCRCGAARSRLVNGLHTETGAWGVDESTVGGKGR